VLRPDANFRGFAGQVAGGVIRPGDAVMALPSGQKSRVDSIVTFDGPLAEASSPMSVTVTLEDEIDLSRGDMLVSPADSPHVSQRSLATIVWMHAQPLETGRSYLIKHCARQVRGKAIAIRHRINIDTLQPEAVERLQMNDIATIELETSNPLFFDAYQLNRTTGSFIVIDPLTNATLAAGMIREDLSESASISITKEILPSRIPLTPLERYQRHGHYPAIILANARPSLASQLEGALFEEGFEVVAVEENSSLSSGKNAWAAVHAAGFVVIYHNPSLSAEQRMDLRSAAGDHFVDLADVELPGGDAEAVERILALVEPLRISPQPGKLGKVN
jgi:hypothetical protein